ncbi:PspC domain protein [Pseudonocardia autotrophica]|jgi:phage shock protein PspC (stress-responsive transcriptional regulator)|uniref:PspC domain-containing protein n=2 Tax=unclassified Pseudonocardia TaxID=2619320 RepID=UPI000911D4F3|nr:PspC domain protein [Pseudonocardia autotrophica]
MENNASTTGTAPTGTDVHDASTEAVGADDAAVTDRVPVAATATGPDATDPGPLGAATSGMPEGAGTAGAGTAGVGAAGPEVPPTGAGPSDAGPDAAADPGTAHPGPGAGAPSTAGAPYGGAGTRTTAQGIGDRVAAFRLRRSSTDRMLGGVCGGLAADLGADAALLRIAVLVLTLVTGGAAALVYLAAWLIAPAA